MNAPNRDRTVAHALDQLPVPEHGAGFWEELEARLAHEDDANALPTTRRTPSRWSAQRTLIVATAAALVLVLGAALLVVRDEDDTRVHVGNAGQTSDPAATSSPTTIAESAARGTPAIGSPESAVVGWLEALGRGDAQSAAAMLGPKSRRYIEDLGGNVEGFMRESEEGYGAWAATPDRSTTEVDLGTVDGAPTTIVVVTGTWRGEGEDGFRSDAIPAVQLHDGWMVEPMAFNSDTGGRLSIESPGPRAEGDSEPSTLEPDDVIIAGAPGAGEFFFSLDDGPPVRVAGERSRGGVRATWDPPGHMPAQTHLLVVAYADGDTLTAYAGRFVVR